MRLLLGLAVTATVVVSIASVASCSDQTNPTGTPPLPPEEDAAVEETGPINPDGSTVTGDPTKGILIEGTVIGENGPFEGQVLTVAGLIACAEPGKACEADPAAAGVAHVTVDGIIAPGLIDTHNHILFDIFDNSDWLPKQAYQNHDDWTKDTNEPRYTVMVDVKQCLEDASQGKPVWCPVKYDGPTGSLRCEMEKWGEMKALAAGTTSIVGLAGTANPCYASLARSIDTMYNGLAADTVQTAAITPSKATADGVCANYASGKTTAYLIHVGEGANDNAAALSEFTDLGTITTTAECLYAPQTAITHGSAFGATEFATMKAKGMKLTWSPASNMALYGQTTRIPMALDNGIVVSIAPDWSMGGSQNMLDELRFAKKHSDANWAGRLKSEDIVAMATKNAASVLGLADKLGTIKKGYVADIFVVHGNRSAPYDGITAAAAKDVVLTMVGGKVLYGDTDVRSIGAGGTLCEDFDACGTPKFFCVAEATATNKLNQTYVQIRDILEAAMKDIDTVRPAAIGGNFSPVAPVVGCAP